MEPLERTLADVLILLERAKRQSETIGDTSTEEKVMKAVEALR
jgi:hypothetical protein